MKSLSLIGIAAALLLLSIACNERIGKARPSDTVKFTPPTVVKDEEVQPAEADKARVQDEALLAPPPPPPVDVNKKTTNAGFNREGYAHIVENRFLNAQQVPLSTFSIDVDAASYSNIRRFIQQCALPPAVAVRIVERLTNFDYRYPIQESEAPNKVTTV